MKTKLLGIFFLVVICLVGQSQTAFQKTYGGTDNDYGSSLHQTNDGGYIIAGSTWSYGPGLESIYLIKTNSIGDTLWTKIYGGAVSSGGVESVQQTEDGGYIIGSGTKSFGAGLQDVYLIKTDMNGNIQWTKTFGGSNVDVCVSIEQTNDGGYAVLGWTQSFGVGNSDIYLIKTDATGNALWRKTYGGVNFDIGTSLQQTTDGGYIISARTNSFGAGNFDAYLIKTNALGDTLWTKTYGGIDVDAASFVRQTGDGGYIISGYTQSFGAGLLDCYLIKTDTIGSSIWSKTFGGISNDASYCVQQVINGEYIIVGYTQSFGAGMSDCYLLKLNSIGDTLWTKTVGGTNNDYAYFVNQTLDDGYIITGQTPVSGFQDVYLIKTDSLGNSSCNNQSVTNTIIGSPSTIVTFPAPQVLSPSGASGTTATVVSIGAFVNTPCISVGVDEMAYTQINNTFPNPFSSETILETSKSLNNASLTIYNSLGQEVKKINNLNGKTIQLQRDNLLSGIYYIQLMQDNKLITTNKIIITD